jgi:hypothetical protein
MKSKLLIFAIIVLVIQIGCETDKKQDAILEYDQITYHEINKTLIGISKDSINIGCYPAIIEIKRNNNSTTSSDSLEAFINYPNDTVENCKIAYFVDDENEKIKCLSEYNIISQYSKWSKYSDSLLLSSSLLFSLSDFKGKGEKYIGFRVSCPPYHYLNEITHYSYGWIKVILNASSDSLKIIDIAINETKTKSILTGQKK